LQRTGVEGILPRGLGSCHAACRQAFGRAGHQVRSVAPRRAAPARKWPTNWPQSRTRRPDQAASRWAALQGDRGAFELHWTAGGRPLAVRGAVGVCLGRNYVARASRCGWLHGLGSRRSKPLMAERNEPVIVTVRVFNDLSECWCRKSKQNGGQSNLGLSHGFHSLCLK
jgi:hypothetical protein